MKNTMLPEEEIKKIREVITKVDEVIDHHSKVEPDVSVEDRVMRIHTLLYLDIMADVLKSVKGLERLLDIDREDFIDLVTDKGEKTVREVETKLMTKMLLDTILG